MFRFCVWFAALVLAAAMFVPSAVAQDYPVELEGGQFVTAGEDIEAWLAAYKFVPYSFPIDGDDFFVGWIESNPLELTVRFSCLMRYPLGECVAPAPAGYRHGKSFDWNPEARCYIEEHLRPDGLIAFDAWVINDTIVWWQGCFEPKPGHPFPTYEFSDMCGLYVYDTRNPNAPRHGKLLQEEQVVE